MHERVFRAPEAFVCVLVRMMKVLRSQRYSSPRNMSSKRGGGDELGILLDYEGQRRGSCTKV